MTTPIDAFWDELKRRMENPFWWSFIISWLIINWKVVYITFSWSSQKIDDKIQYIENLYKFSSFMEWFFSIANLFIFPLFASAIAIWWIPILAREYLRKQIKNKESDDALRINEIKSEKLVIQEKIDLQEKEQKLEKSEREEWDKEYVEIEKAGIIPKMVHLIFEKNWNRYNYRWDDNIDTYTLAVAIKYDLLTEIEKWVYELTEKGKYVIKKYPSEKLKTDLVPF